MGENAIEKTSRIKQAGLPRCYFYGVVNLESSMLLSFGDRPTPYMQC